MRLLKLYQQKKKQRLKEGLDDDHKGLEYVFSDLNNKRYFKIPTVMGLPPERFAAQQKFFTLMGYGVSEVEQLEFIKLVQEETIKTLMGDKSASSKIGAACHFMQERLTLEFHVDLVYSTIAASLIREDEPLHTYTDIVNEEKVIAFKEMVSRGGASAFFSRLSFLTFANKLTQLSEIELNELLNDSHQKVLELRKRLSFLKSERKLENALKTSKSSS